MSNQLLKRAIVALSAVFALVVVMVAPASAQPESYEGKIELLEFCVGDPADELCFEIPDDNGNGLPCPDTDDAEVAIELSNIVADQSADLAGVSVSSETFAEIPDASVSEYFVTFEAISGSGDVDLQRNPAVEVEVLLDVTMESVDISDPACPVVDLECQFQVPLELGGDWSGPLPPNPPPATTVTVAGDGVIQTNTTFCPNLELFFMLNGEDAVVNVLELLFED